MLTNSDPTVTLTAGTNYWVEVAPGALDTSAAWEYNDVGKSGRFVEWHYDSGAFGTPRPAVAGAMEITTVPEPFTMALCAAGLGLAFARRRRVNRS